MFKEIDVRDIKENTVKMIADEWMLISAGNEEAANMMTASWGMLGELWFKDVAVCFIRPQRYTLKFVEENDTFALCFFGTEQKEALSFCGSKSGKDCDKIKESGLTPVFGSGTVYFEEAKTVIICKKMAVSNINPSDFCDESIDEKCYPSKDYHKIFIGKIEKVLQKE